MCVQPWIEILFTPSWGRYLEQQKINSVTVYRNQTFYLAANVTSLTANVENNCNEKNFCGKQNEMPTIWKQNFKVRLKLNYSILDLFSRKLTEILWLTLFMRTDISTEYFCKMLLFLQLITSGWGTTVGKFLIISEQLDLHMRSSSLWDAT